MKKIIIPLVSLLLIFFGSASAQDDSGSGGSFKPAAGDISGAIMFGRSLSELNYQLYAPFGPSGGSWSVSGSAPIAYSVDDYNGITNMIGGEGRYFITNQIAVKASGFGIIRNTPPRDNVPGFIEATMPNAGWIPDYAAVVADNSVDMNINIGGEYHFTSKFDRVDPWAGVTVPFYYGRHSQYDPSVTMNISSIDTGTPSLNNEVFVADVGPRHAEMAAFGGNAVGGVDFYLMEGLFIGFEIKPISYIYAYMLKYPAPGLPSLGSDTHTWSFMSQPMFKVGFRF